MICLESETVFDKIDAQRRATHIFSGNEVCYFCNKPITKLDGKVSESRCTHHLNGDRHDNNSKNIVSAHIGCHVIHHNQNREHIYNPISIRRKWLQSQPDILLCYFCKKIVIKNGLESISLLIHSLDGNHDNWDPNNKVPTHKGCHQSYHISGKPKTLKHKQKLRELNMGEKNPRFGKTVTNESRIKMSKSHLGSVPWNKNKKIGPYTEKHVNSIRKGVNLNWIERRKKYGRTGGATGRPRK